MRRRFSSYDRSTGCAVEACLEVIGGKWKGIILHHLMNEGVLRFSQIQRLKPNLSPRILTAQLRELEEDGVIVRKVYPVVPPKVEYSLSNAGESLRPVIQAMQDWGDAYRVQDKTSPSRSGDSRPLNEVEGRSGLRQSEAAARTSAMDRIPASTQRGTSKSIGKTTGSSSLARSSA